MDLDLVPSRTGRIILGDQSAANDHCNEETMTESERELQRGERERLDRERERENDRKRH